MPSAETRKQVAELRSFNRLYTQRIGVLNQRLLESPFSLAEARVLYELAHDEGCTASKIRQQLQLDAGYLSRIVRGFAERGLLVRKRSASDSREFALSLTAAGRRAFRELDQRSRRQASSMLSGLPDASRHELLDGIERAKRVLAGDAREDKKIVLRTPALGDIGWAIERHGRLYADEFGWNAEFEALVATLFAAFATKHDAGRERCWIAEVDGQRAGCVFVVTNEDDPTMAQLRCLLVDPSARGLGLGKRLVDQCIRFARAAGYRGIMLWTNDVLVAARKIYESAGFVLDKHYHHRSFGKELVGQIWSLRFEERRNPDSGHRSIARRRRTKNGQANRK